MLTKVERAPADSGDDPLVIMLVGVNGVGKTTTIAKLSARLKEERGPVIVAAATPFAPPLSSSWRSGATE